MQTKKRKATSREVYIDMEELRYGLVALEDTTKTPFGSARRMRNCTITDRGGISPRPGIKLVGTNNTSGNPVRGLYNFRRSFETNEILVKTYGTEVEAFSKNAPSPDWFRLENGFTADKEFGFVNSLSNQDNTDYLIFCNRFENYRSWNGEIAYLTSDLSGGETTLTVDSTLTAEVFDAQTATGSTTATLTVSSAPWAADQWNNLYVYITSGTESGQIRKITDTTTDTITFDALGADPSNPTFEIRKLKFAGTTGTVVYNGTTIDYTAITTATGITVASAHAGTTDDAVTEVPVEYAGNPRGNRFTNYLGRIVVGNVRSAVARGNGGALQGYASGGSYFVSQVNDPLDFSYAATRVAGEGDVAGTPYGGGEITDVSAQEDLAYVFKGRYIEAFKYTQDDQDLIQREPLKAEIGSIGPVIKGSDDIYFITSDNKLTSIGRVRAKDIKPQTENIGHPIKRLMDQYKFGEGRGFEYKDRIYIPAKSSSTQTANDIVIVYNKIIDRFEGIWDLSVNFIQEFDEGLYMGDSLSSNVYEMLVGRADVEGNDRFAISAEYLSHFFNLASSNASQQAMNSIFVEGYIAGGTEINFSLFKDFSNDAILNFTFGGTEEQFLDGEEISAFLGSEALGSNPLGTIGELDEDGRRHFSFRVYFPFKYGEHFSFGFKSSGTDDNYEITRFGFGLKETISTDIKKVKSI